VSTKRSAPRVARRALLKAVGGGLAALLGPKGGHAGVSFDQWIDAFRAKAVARGISEEPMRA
jgi:hypothetical protein